jgi:hypothetical protein
MIKNSGIILIKINNNHKGNKFRVICYKITNYIRKEPTKLDKLFRSFVVCMFIKTQIHISINRLWFERHDYLLNNPFFGT